LSKSALAFNLFVRRFEQRIQAEGQKDCLIPAPVWKETSSSVTPESKTAPGQFLNARVVTSGGRAMRDQIIGIYVIPLIAQMLVPLVLLGWQSLVAEHSRIAWIMKTSAVAAYLVAIAVAGLWLVVPWYVSVIYVLIFIALILRASLRIWQMAWWPRAAGGQVGIAIRGVVLICSIGVVAYAWGGRQLPASDPVDVRFPMRHGVYYVVAGGSNSLLNPHVEALTAERLRQYRGEGYGTDIVAVNAAGMRARGIAPADPRKYAIFGAAVYAPCSGVVLRTESGLPDMPPPEPDRSHPAGNYVFLDCAGHHVLLAHFQKGTVRVQSHESVTVGTLLGQVGNSGNSGEPHLHIHAQRPSANEAFLGGDPVPVRFNGRYLARNDWLREDVGPLAPPTGGIVVLSAIFVVLLVYRITARRSRRW
jgi:hypothetical protein